MTETTGQGLEPFEDFLHRHVGTSDDEQAVMLKELGFESLDALIDAAVPGSVRSLDALHLPPAATEYEVLEELRFLAASNEVLEPMIGLGYYGTITPGVIRRNVLEVRPGTPPIRRTSPRSVRGGSRPC